MPTTIHQGLAFLAALAFGVFVSQFLVMPLFMNRLLKPEKLGRAPGDTEVTERSVLRYLGAMEIVLYATAIVYRYPQFILVWLATKYVARWHVWSEQRLGRTFYNHSLFGSALNIVLGALTGALAQILICAA